MFDVRANYQHRHKALMDNLRRAYRDNLSMPERKPTERNVAGLHAGYKKNPNPTGLEDHTERTHTLSSQTQLGDGLQHLALHIQLRIVHFLNHISKSNSQKNVTFVCLMLRALTLFHFSCSI